MQSDCVHKSQFGKYIHRRSRFIGFAKSSSMRFPNKVSAVPHWMSFKVDPEDKTKRMVFDPLMAPGFMSISTPNAYDPSQKCSMTEIQSFNRDSDVKTHLSLSACPMQCDAGSFHHPQDAKMFLVVNDALSISSNNRFFNNQYATTGKNMVGATMNLQLLGGIPVTGPHSVLPTAGFVDGKTESCFKATSGSPAQLTIFYAGMVNVYSDICLEKAQAIMFLAGNEPPISSNTADSKVQIRMLGSDPAAAYVGPFNEPITTPPRSHLSSPLSVSSRTSARSGRDPSSPEEMTAAKTVEFATIIPSVPQARKASLARFLEKRKQRFMNAAPYNLNNISLGICCCIIKWN